MVKLLLFFFVSLLSFFPLIAQVNFNSVKNFLENSAFQSGEVLKYEVSYGIIKGGVAELNLDVVNQGGDWFYYSRAVAQTAGVAAKLFTIYDVYDSFFSIDDGLPIRATRNIREEKYLKYNEILFRRSDSTLFSLLSGQKKIPAETLDVLSAFYFARRYLFKEVVNIGDTIHLLTYFDDKLYDINIALEKKELIRTKFGKINVLKFSPVIDGKLFTEKNQMEVWFTNDLNFIPILIRIDLHLSKINCQLIDYTGLKSKKSELNFR
jgi:hypothetical protein